MNNLKRKKLEKRPQASYDTSLNKIKDNKIVTSILILFIIYTGLSEIIKKTYENVENLYGEKGLLKKNDTANYLKILESDAAEIPKVQMPVIEDSQRDKSVNHLTQRIIRRDTVTFIRRDTVYLLDTSMSKSLSQKYSFRQDELKEGRAFVDPLTNSTISIFRIQPDFTASAILDYPDGFNTIYFEKPDPVKVQPGDYWNDIYFHQKKYKMTIVKIDYLSKTFSVEIRKRINVSLPAIKGI